MIIKNNYCITILNYCEILFIIFLIQLHMLYLINFISLTAVIILKKVLVMARKFYEMK